MTWSVEAFPAATKFIRKLPESVNSRVVAHIDLLEKYGPNLRVPVVKKIAKNLFELRLVGQDSIRLLYCSYRGGFYILNAFRKKSQKIPGKEIKLAVDRMKLLI